MDLFKRIQDLSSLYDDDGPSAMVPESRPMFNDGGMLVKPSNDGSRPGYAKVKRTSTTKDINKLDVNKKKIKLNGDAFITGEVRSYVPKNVAKKYVDDYLSFVDKNYLKNDMSMVEPFQAYIKNKYPKKYAKIISDVNQSGYRGLKNISTTYKKALANELITSANNQLKFVNQMDILKKLVSPSRAAAYERSGGLSARPPEWADENTLKNFKNLDKMEDKLSKSLTYIVENNLKIINPKKLKIPGSGASKVGASPIRKMIHYLAGGGSEASLNKALEINPWYQSQNFKVGDTTKNTFDYLSRQYGKDFIGQPFNTAYNFALQRRGRISLKGMKNQPLPENLIWDFAARSAIRNFNDGVPIEEWPVKILDKKGNVVDLGKFPVDASGRKLLNTSELQFDFNGEIFNRNNLKTKGVESGFFNDIYKVSSEFDDYLKQDVPDPDNPKKTIKLKELFDKTEGRIFASIGHDDARGGVKKRPFNSFKILTNVENLSLFNAYDKIKNPADRKKVVDFIYGNTKGLRGDKYKQAWINKNVPFITEYIKTGQGLEQTPYRQGVDKFLNPQHQQLIKNQFCPGNKVGGPPGTCPFGEAMDNMIKQTNAVKQGTIKGAEATRIAQKASKVARFGTGAGLAKFLGPIGLAGEAVFEVGMAVPGYARGESGKRLLGDSILGLIPGVGQSAEEEFAEYATKDGMSQLDQQKIKDVNRFLELNNSLPSALKNIGKGGRGDPLKGARTFEKQYEEYEPLYNQFVGGPPSESASTAFAEQQRINDLINADKAIRAEQRNIAMDEDFMAAGGGIAKLAGDRSGPPPESGPNSQGLQGLFNRVKKV